MITALLDDAPTRSTDSANAPSFSPTDYALGIIQSMVSARQDSRVVLPGHGEIAVLPSRGAFQANVHDMAEFCRAPGDRFEVSALENPALSGGERPLSELLWQAAFHASQGRLVAGCSKYDVVQFRHWPNLSRLPLTGNAMRICALLTRHPTTIMLVHRKLGVETSEVYQIYSAAHSAGVSTRVSRNPEATMEAYAADDKVEPEQRRSLFRSLFAKIAGL